MDAFSTTIGESEYRPDETRTTIGLYGSQYTIHFEPDESPADWEYLCILTLFA